MSESNPEFRKFYDNEVFIKHKIIENLFPFVKAIQESPYPNKINQIATSIETTSYSTTQVTTKKLPVTTSKTSTKSSVATTRLTTPTKSFTTVTSTTKSTPFSTTKSSTSSTTSSTTTISTTPSTRLITSGIKETTKSIDLDEIEKKTNKANINTISLIQNS